MKIKPRHIGFVIKHQHPEANALTLTLAQIAISKKIALYFADESTTLAQQLKASLPDKQKKLIHIVQKSALVKSVQLVVVLGGDGTLLSIARKMNQKSVPVLGINMGQLGFLTEIKKTEAEAFFKSILRGKSVPISERTLFEVTLKRRKKTIFQGAVVNDAVISKGAIARIIGLEVSVNGTWAHTVKADGIIVSTPTGSTAYSLAAGGPIIEPTLGSMAITPICAHSLTQRPLVLSDNAAIQICLSHEPGHVYLTLDGQDAVDLKQGDLIEIRKYKKHRLQLISSDTRDYFSLLREKLNFGMRL